MDKHETAPGPKGRGRVVFSILLLALTACFVALGTWQVQRRFEKLDLIERVNARVHANAVAAPDQTQWPTVSKAGDEYRRVTVSGRYDYSKDTLVQAVTELGAGFWVLTPLLRDDGTTVLINRGFVPGERRERQDRAAAETTDALVVTGLLRINEPGGAFLRSNSPHDDRWYSRDVGAIAEARNLKQIAPYFIDADATPNPGGLPVGGLTVVNFRNSHLTYIFTWYALAAMSVGAAYAVHRRRFV